MSHAATLPHGGTTAHGARELLLLMPLVVVAAVIYRPWEATLFPIGDWGGLLSHFQGNDGMAARYRSLMDAYLRDGRYQPGLLAGWAFGWTVLGDHPLRWQLMRFALMVANITVAFVFLRRVGSSAAAGAASLVLFVLSAMASQSWMLLQIPEPLGLLFVLLACVLAATYQRTAKPISHAVGLGASLVAAILMKETYIIAVPFVLALATCVVGPGDYRLPSRSRRNVALVAAIVGAVLVVNILPVLHTRAGATASSYASQYRLDTLTFSQVRNVFASMFLPVTRVPWFPANVAFAAILVAGAVFAIRRRAGSAPLIAYAIALGLPLLGALLYLPWPTIEGYYGAAALPGLTLAFALALTWIDRAGSTRIRLVTVAAVALIVLHGALFARSYVVAYRADREVEAETAAVVGRYPNARELVVGVPSPATAGHFADGLRRYALARGVRNLPPGRDVTCDEAARLANSPTSRTMVVAFVPWCGEHVFAGSVKPQTIRRTYVTRDWKTFRGRTAESVAHVWAGG